MVVLDNPAENQFELHDVSGEEPTILGVAYYRPDGDHLVVPHVETLDRLRGQGYGAVLMDGVVAQLEASGRTITPLCGYAASYLRGREETHHLIA